MHWPRGCARKGCRSTTGRAARAMAITNAWCAIPTAIASRSWRVEQDAEGVAMRAWVCGLAILVGAASAAPPPAPVSAWPDVTKTAKPWTRWWWPGSAVDGPGITKQLEQFAAAGIGGVEITPIYGARGAESR